MTQIEKVEMSGSAMLEPITSGSKMEGNTSKSIQYMEELYSLRSNIYYSEDDEEYVIENYHCFLAALEKEKEDGKWYADILAIQGVIYEGETIKEVMEKAEQGLKEIISAKKEGVLELKILKPDYVSISPDMEIKMIYIRDV